MIFFPRFTHRYFLKIVLLFFFISCKKSPDLQISSPSCQRPPLIKSSIIIGDNDWKDYTQVGDNLQNENELSVALIKIPKLSANCNGFLINDSVLMTNNHCIPSSAEAMNVKAVFRNEFGERSTYECQEFIYTNAQLDFTLIGCSGFPGKKFAWARLSKEKIKITSDVYTIEENCDYFKDPYCTINKFVSYGTIQKSQEMKVNYDLDTLPGSSGSPVFSLENHAVIAIHHAGIYETSQNEASNEGIPMFKIRALIESKLNIQISKEETMSTTAADQVIANCQL